MQFILQYYYCMTFHNLFQFTQNIQAIGRILGSVLKVALKIPLVQPIYMRVISVLCCPLFLRAVHNYISARYTCAEIKIKFKLYEV